MKCTQSDNVCWISYGTVMFGREIDPCLFPRIFEFAYALKDKTVKDYYSLSEKEFKKVDFDSVTVEDLEGKGCYRKNFKTAVLLADDAENEDIVVGRHNSERVDELRRMFAGRGEKLCVQFDVDGLNESRMQNIIEFCDRAKEKGFDVSISVFRGVLEPTTGRIPYVYNENELSKLGELNAYSLRVLGKEITHEIVPTKNDQKRWTHEEVLKSNQTIKSIAKTIMSYNFSPFETMLVLHKYASSFDYIKSNTFPQNARAVTGILTGGESVVCVGYAQLVKAIADEINSQNLKVELNLLKFYPYNKFKFLVGECVNHCNNLVSINDEKYDIKGLYMDDACEDAVIEDVPTGEGLTNFMFPISDANKFAKKHICDSEGKSMQELNEYIIIRPLFKTRNRCKLIKYKETIKDLIKDLKSPLSVLSRSNQGRVIPFKKIKSACTEVYKKLMPEMSDKQIQDLVDDDLSLSIFFAAVTFDKTSSNTFSVMGRKLKEQDIVAFSRLVAGNEEGKEI